MQAMNPLRIDGVSIAVSELGRGEPVLLLHGSVSSSAQWRGLAARLAERFHVFAPDLYGYGASGAWPSGKPFSVSCEARIIEAIVERAGARVHLVAHSYGGLLALHFACGRPAWTRSLALIEPAAFRLLASGDAADARALHELASEGGEISRALSRGELSQGMGRFIDYWNGAGTWDALPPPRRGALSALAPRLALDFDATFGEPVEAGRLSAMAVPTLLVRGTRSPEPMLRICERLAAVLPDVSAHRIESAGHMLPVTHADRVNDLVAAHLDSRLGLRSRGALAC